MRRAVIYTRISLDRDGTSTSTARQEIDCRRLCASRSFDVQQVFVDTDVSAYKRNVERPEYEKVVQQAKLRAFDVLVVWKLDRLSRSVADFTKLLEMLTALDIELVAVNDPIDTTSPTGRAMVQLVSVFSELEAATTAARVSSYHEHAAKTGKPHTGGSRPFGYDRQHNVIEPEAEIVREIARLYLEHESLASIATSLNDRSLHTSRGGQWTSEGISQMLRSPRIAGFRTYRGELYPGQWEPILDFDTWRRCQDYLEESRSRVVRKQVASHLLTGIAVCGLCANNLRYGVFTMKNGNAFPRYACLRRPGQPNCGGVTVSMRALDKHVTDHVLTLVEQGVDPLNTVRKPPNQRSNLVQQIEADNEALKELTLERYVERRISKDAYEAARSRLEYRLHSSQAELRSLDVATTADAIAGQIHNLNEWWDEASLDRKKQALSLLVETVIVNKAAHRGGNRFQDERVQIIWRK